MSLGSALARVWYEDARTGPSALLFEALNLRRTHRLEPFPVILAGRAYWEGLLDWLRSAAVAGGTLSEEDLDRLTVTDDPPPVVGPPGGSACESADA